MDGMIVPPSNTLVDQVKRNRIGALTRCSTCDWLARYLRLQAPTTEFGRMMSSELVRRLPSGHW